MRADIPEQPADTQAIRQALTDDVLACEEALKAADTQLARRNFVRAAFAHVEGMVSLYRSMALDMHRRGQCDLSRAELSLLLEETYELTEGGDVRSRPYFSQMARGIRFAFDMLGRSHGFAERPDYGGYGWRALRRAIEIRHRITHPKVVADVALTDDELHTVETGYHWFFETVSPWLGMRRLRSSESTHISPDWLIGTISRPPNVALLLPSNTAGYRTPESASWWESLSRFRTLAAELGR